jgi:hypothetical protein
MSLSFLKVFTVKALIEMASLLLKWRRVLSMGEGAAGAAVQDECCSSGQRGGLRG